MRRGRNVDWNQLGFVKLSDRVDTHLMLLIADAVDVLETCKPGRYSREQMAELFAVPGQGGVTPKDRLRELMQVVEFWDGGLLQAAIELNAPWHTMTEVARSEGIDSAAVFTFVDEYIERKGAWPHVDDLRRFMGKKPSKRLPGEQEDQGVLG
jgi:hypothetical protein